MENIESLSQKKQKKSKVFLGFLRGFLRKEFKQSLRDPRMRIILFVTPLVQLILFGVALSTDVKNIRIWTEDTPKDYMLQHLYEHSIQSQWFLPAKSPQNEDPYDLLRKGKIDVALVPPPGGVTRSAGQKKGEVQVLIDAMNVIQAQSVESYLKSISQRVAEDDLEQEKIQNPIQFSTRVLFNPDLETSFFMVPGVMCILMCITTVILTSISITREKEYGTFEMLISAPTTASQIILGKTVPYVILGMANAPLILAVAVFVFNVPMRGSLLVWALAAFVFICTMVAVGTLISTFARNQQQSTIGGFLFLFPAILFSGLLFPIENMPEILKWFSYLNPLSHFLALLRNILLKGGEAHFILVEVGILIMMAVVLIFISFKRFRTTLQ